VRCSIRPRWPGHRRIQWILRTVPGRTLLAVTGLSPQVVTETVYALARAHPRALPTEIHVVITAEGAERARLALFSRVPRWFPGFAQTSRWGPSTSNSTTYIMEDVFLGVAGDKADQRIALNLTGGTKLMALAAQTVAAAARWQSFYVDVDTDQAIPLNKTHPARSLAPTLGLSHYLQACGFRREPLPQPPPLDFAADELLQTLVIQVGSLEKPLGQLNWLVQVAEARGQLDVRLTAEQLDSRGLIASLGSLEDARLVTLHRENLRFAETAGRSFAKGGWVMAHAAVRVRSMISFALTQSRWVST
jgi:hypothetical protein